ncbi:MAG: 2,3-bisphosphoglycerate-independent phosphoglycerate mutase [bacterium]|nr:2,3-bisphosphoglycerate-independent phosphoglycerate mutase [bacterium]
MQKKCLFILLDGIGDRSYAELNNKTPLQAAKTPMLDRIASIGSTGLYHATQFGEALPSEIAHHIMLGYDITEFPGRGPLEAIGAGIDLEADDVAILASFASVKEKDEEDSILILEKKRPEMTDEEIETIITAAGEYHKEGINIHFTPTEGLSGILTLRGEVSPFITDTDPMIEGNPIIDVRPWHDYRADPFTLNTEWALRSYLEAVYRRLKKHPLNQARIKEGLMPVNFIVTQRAGSLNSVCPFSEKYGMKALSISSGAVYKGLSKYLGFDHHETIDSDNPGNDIAERISLARESFENHDFIHVHSKWPDKAAHTKNPFFKKEVIESLDRGIGESIEPLLANQDVLIIITGDHSTPSSGSLIHSGEPVPVIFSGSGVRVDEVSEYNEVSTAPGALGAMRGKEFISMALNYMDRAKLIGTMDTPVNRPFWPGKYEPFRPE